MTSILVWPQATPQIPDLGARKHLKYPYLAPVGRGNRCTGSLGGRNVKKKCREKRDKRETVRERHTHREGQLFACLKVDPQTSLGRIETDRQRHVGRGKK